MAERILPEYQPSFGAAGRDILPVHLRSRVYRLLILLLAVVYGAVLSQIPSEQFKDFANYLVYAEHSWPRLMSYLDQGLLAVLANEPVWLLINSGLAVVLPPETVVRVIVFVSATLVAWFVLRSNSRHVIWLMVFLLLPVVLNNHLVHLRQGAAIGLFLWGWRASARSARWALMGLTPFIHASFFFVLLVLSAARAMTRMRLAADVRTLVFVGMGVATWLGIAWLAAAVGARQAGRYDFGMGDVSGLGFVFWLGMALAMVLEGRRFLREHVFESGMVVFYLSTYWLIEITARIFEGGLILVLLAGLALTGWRRAIFLYAILLYGLLMWLERIGQPALGFGIG